MDRHLNQEGDIAVMGTHAGAFPCFEGVQRVPENWDPSHEFFEGPCCEVFEGHTKACTFDIRYEWWPKAGFWVTMIDLSAGGGGVKISYCPHCGAAL